LLADTDRYLKHFEMKKALYVIIMALLTFLSCRNQEKHFEIISFNIRLDHSGDGKNQWSKRTFLVNGYFDKVQPAIIGMQEVLPNQLKDLEEMLEGYSYISVGRDDGESSGEACPVFFKKNLFNLLEGGHFWLSETPDKPGSMSWGTHYPRIVTWAKLESTDSGFAIFMFNTHFSHISEEARSKSVDLLLKQMRKIAGQSPVLLTGDFNTSRDTETYSRLIGGGENLLQLWDAEVLAPSTRGGSISYNAFDREFQGTRIDFVFVNKYIDVSSHIVDEVKENGLFISDHYPVRAGFNIRTEPRKKRDPQ
jgi:endonuclease/exonuclease/phosphatase family metal-dependent hydrolase